jgi:16S rRNA (cytosine1402-N4)-methyltransferase
MLAECLHGLALKPDGVYVDVTFGGGGHSRAMLAQVPQGRLLAFDQDPDAAANSEGLDPTRFTLIAANFRHLRKYLKFYGLAQVDGILADLGISSHQIDQPARGFSTRFEAPIDMRMDQAGDLNASSLLNTYSEEELRRVLTVYGELANARQVAYAVMKARAMHPIVTVNDLKNALTPLAPRGKENKFYAQVFQALRIEVNEEIKVLEEFLLQTPEVLKPGGRLVVMSYHSLEDRLVKNYMRAGNFSGEIVKDLYGNDIKPLQPLTRKPLTPSEQELLDNPRSRSAHLRIAERLP